MPDGILIPPDAVTGEGYTLMQFVERVRRVLRPETNAFSTPSLGKQGFTLAQFVSQVRSVLPASETPGEDVSLGAQGYTMSQARAQVRNMLRDPGKEAITDAEIDQWLIDGSVDVATRTRSVRTKVTGTTLPTGQITLPGDFLEARELTFGATDDQLAVFADDQTWWDARGSTPPKTLYRPYSSFIETYPVQNFVPYTLRYIATAAGWAVGLDASQTNLPTSLQYRAIAYAKAMALYKLEEPAAPAYLALAQGEVPADIAFAAEESTAKEETGQYAITRTGRVVAPLALRVKRIDESEIVDMLNEGAMEVAIRTRSTRARTALVAGRATPLPAGVMEIVAVESDGKECVPAADEQTWYDYLNAGVAPPRPMYRLPGDGTIEVFPASVNGGWLYYLARPSTMVVATDQIEVPFELQNRVVNYARGHCLTRLGQPSAQQYFALFSGDLRPASGTGDPRLEPQDKRESEVLKPIFDYEIVDYVNEALLQLAARTQTIVHEATGTTDGTPLIPKPFDLVRVEFLRLYDSGAANPYSDVEMVTDDLFNSWFNGQGGDANTTISRTLGRVYAGNIETYPAPSAGQTYVLRYIARPMILVLPDDRCELPAELQNRAVEYARGMCKLKEGDRMAYRDYMAMFETSLPTQDVHARIRPGPRSLGVMPGPFESAESMHV